MLRHDQGIHHHINATPIDGPIRPIPRLHLPWVSSLILNRAATGSMTVPADVYESKDLSFGHTHTKRSMGTWTPSLARNRESR